MPARRTVTPDRRTSLALPNATQVRLTTEQHRHLTVEAARRGVGLSAALREILQAHLERRPPLPIEQDGGEGAVPYRAALAGMDDDALVELGQRLAGDDDGA